MFFYYSIIPGKDNIMYQYFEVNRDLFLDKCLEKIVDIKTNIKNLEHAERFTTLTDNQINRYIELYDNLKKLESLTNCHRNYKWMIVSKKTLDMVGFNGLVTLIHK